MSSASAGAIAADGVSATPDDSSACLARNAESFGRRRDEINYGAPTATPSWARKRGAPRPWWKQRLEVPSSFGQRLVEELGAS